MQLVYGYYFLISIFIFYLAAPIYINILFKNKNEKVHTTILFITIAEIIVIIIIASVMGMIGLI